jgi:hypothetical protein
MRADSFNTEPWPEQLPPESSIAASYANANLADAFAIDLPDDASSDIHHLARALVGRKATWITMLMRLRDLMVSCVGLKTSGQVRAAASAAGVEHIDIFPVQSRSEREIIAGETDKHLDFRVSVLTRSRAGGDGRELVLTTVVHCHNLLGRSYLLLITPFHRLIVKAYLRDAARHGWVVD